MSVQWSTALDLNEIGSRIYLSYKFSLHPFVCFYLFTVWTHNEPLCDWILPIWGFQHRVSWCKYLKKKLMHLSLSELVETLKKIVYQLKNLLNVVYLTNTGASIMFNNCGTLEKNLKILFCLQTKISMSLYRSTAVHVIYPPPPPPSTPLQLSPAMVTPQFLIWNENENNQTAS